MTVVPGTFINKNHWSRDGSIFPELPIVTHGAGVPAFVSVAPSAAPSIIPFGMFADTEGTPAVLAYGSCLRYVRHLGLIKFVTAVDTISAYGALLKAQGSGSSSFEQISSEDVPPLRAAQEQPKHDTQTVFTSVKLHYSVKLYSCWFKSEQASRIHQSLTLYFCFLTLEPANRLDTT